MKTIWASYLVLVLISTLSVSVRAAPSAMSRNEIITLGKSVVGYSYWWGGGSWRMDGAQHGSCSGSCPDCTHSGSYGADCSGFVAKAWQIPSPSSVETNSHPYNTSHFRTNTTYWAPISRSSAKAADAAVYNTNGSGHIVLYESGDAWGSIYSYECRGCSYGCVHNLRTLSDSYIMIRRDLIQDTASNGTLRGVVFVDVGKGTDDMNTRIPGAKVSISGGGSVTASDPDANWSFSVAAGDYTITASAGGYKTGSRTCTAASGTTIWCSIGLFKEEACVPNCSGRECGPDPVCGESCGACSENETCSAEGQCVCIPDCADRECGPDPVCGESCGECSDDQICNAEGRCDCVPDCTDRACGLDPVCGTTDCGACAEDEVCTLEGECQATDANWPLLHGYVVHPPEDEADPDLSTAERVSDAEVSLSTGRTVTSDEDGHFQFRVEAGEYLVSAEADGALRGEVTCSVGEDDLDDQSEPCCLRLRTETEIDPDEIDTDSDDAIQGDTDTSHDLEPGDTEPEDEVDSEKEPGATGDSEDEGAASGDKPLDDAGFHAEGEFHACSTTHVGLSEASPYGVLLLLFAITLLRRRVR